MRIDLTRWEAMLVGGAIAEALRASPHLYDDEKQREALWGVEEKIRDLIEDEPPLTQDQYDRLVNQNRRLLGVPLDAPDAAQVVVTRREVAGVGTCKVLTYEDGMEFIYDEQGRQVFEGGIDIYVED